MTASPYEELLGQSRGVALELLASTEETALERRAAFIHRHARELAANTANLAPLPLGESIGAEALRIVRDSWSAVVSGKKSGEAIVKWKPRFWERLMTEWPMGAYAELAAAHLKSHRDLRGARVLELGAGVGNTSRLIAEDAGEGYLRTDLHPGQLQRCSAPGAIARYDFNGPGEWRDLDIVFAVNALHCASSIERSLGCAYEMLRPGGLLLLAEGEPRTTETLPWALTYFFGLFDGWWNVGGFRARTEWREALQATGFVGLGAEPMRAGEHDLGGLVWGRKP